MSMEKSPFAGPVTDRLVNETAPRTAEAETIIIPRALALRRPVQAATQCSPRLVDLDIERANREPLTPEALLRLVWRAQAEHGQQQTGLMTAICNQVASLVERVARNIAGEMPEDYRIQVGLARVPWAVMNYRPDDDPGRDFEAYLGQRIKWAILDEVRSHMVAEGVSQRDHEKIDQAIQKAKNAGEKPSKYLHELTQGKDGLLVVGGMVGADGTIRSPQTSLEALVYPEDGDENQSALPSAVHDVHEIMSKKEELSNIDFLLKTAIDFLTLREKYIYIYYHGLFGINDHSCKIIGDHLGMSEFRVKKILTRVSMKVTRLLNGEELTEADSRLKRQKKSESKEEFLARINEELGSYDSSRLLDIEVASVLDCLPSWQHRPVTKNDRDYNLLVCRVGEQMTDVDLATYSTERRQVLWVNSSLAIATKELTGSDLRLCIELDRQVAENKPAAPQKYILPEIPSPFPEKLTQQHRKVIELLFLPNDVIVSRLGISKSTVRSHISEAASLLGIKEGYTNVNLMIDAMKNGWLEVAGIPVGRTDVLSEKEKEILRDCYDMTYQEAAAAKVLSVSTIRTHWSHIFGEMRVSERRQAVAIAVMDGLGRA